MLKTLEYPRVKYLGIRSLGRLGRLLARPSLPQPKHLSEAPARGPGKNPDICRTRILRYTFNDNVLYEIFAYEYT